MEGSIPFPDTLEVHKNDREFLIEAVPATNPLGVLRFYTRISEGRTVINSDEMEDFGDPVDAIQFGLFWIRKNVQ